MGARWHERLPPAAAAQVPLLANMRPHGKYHMSDLDSIGGVPVVMKARRTMRARARPGRPANAQRELPDGGEANAGHRVVLGCNLLHYVATCWRAGASRRRVLARRSDDGHRQDGRGEPRRREGAVARGSAGTALFAHRLRCSADGSILCVTRRACLVRSSHHRCLFVCLECNPPPRTNAV